MNRQWKMLIGAMLMPLVASCGGGAGGAGVAFGGDPGTGTGGGEDTGVGGSGGLVGPAQGFGSIIINDVEMNTDSARFEIEGQSVGMGQTAQSRLAEGQQLVVRGDIEGGTATEVFYRSDIKGPLEGAPVFDPITGVGQLTVLGQTVELNAVTRYRGVAPSLLQSGDLLEISGARDSAGDLVATFVGLEDALTEFKVVGTVTSVQASGFTVGALIVDTGSAAGTVDPSVGDEVEVHVDAAGYVPGAAATATRVDVLDPVDVQDGERFEVEGYVDSLDAGGDFTVDGFHVVVLPDTRFDGGGAGDLALDVRLEVEGTINAASDLEAERIVFKPVEAVRAESAVASTDLTAATLTTAVGVTFAIRDLTELDDGTGANVDPLTLADLAAGDFVEARGFVDAGQVITVELRRVDPGRETRLRAPADAAPTVDADGNLHVMLVGADVIGGATTKFQGASGDVTRDQFAAMVEAGTVVEARWQTFSPGTPADELRIEDSGGGA